MSIQYINVFVLLLAVYLLLPTALTVSAYVLGASDGGNRRGLMIAFGIGALLGYGALAWQKSDEPPADPASCPCANEIREAEKS
jgi:hypothetical protein